MKARHWLILVLASLFLAACASSASGAGSKAPPDGEYREQDASGSLKIVLNQGHFTTSHTASSTGPTPAPLAEGSYRVDGDKITFHEEKLSDEAKSFCGSKTTYSFRWTFDKQNNLLSFKKDNDPCYEREQAHLSGPFVYSPSK